MNESLILKDYKICPSLVDGIYTYNGKKYFPIDTLDITVLSVYDVLFAPTSPLLESINKRLLGTEFLYVPGKNYMYGTWFIPNTNKKIDPIETQMIGYRQPD